MPELSSPFYQTLTILYSKPSYKSDVGIPHYPISLPEIWLSKCRKLTDMGRETHVLVITFSKEELIATRWQTFTNSHVSCVENYACCIPFHYYDRAQTWGTLIRITLLFVATWRKIYVKVNWEISHKKLYTQLLQFLKVTYV